MRVEHSAGGVVVRTVEGVPRVLMIRDPYKKWGLPKGRAKVGERPHETALREVREETGLDDLVLGPELVTIDWRFTARGDRVHKYATFFLMYSDEGDPRPEAGEGISGCAWVPLPEAHETISYGNASEVVKVAQRLLAGGASPDARGAARGDDTRDAAEAAD